jgi:hypothetical protein
MTGQNARDKPDQPPSTEHGDEPPERPASTDEVKQASALIRERFGIGR